MLRAEAYFRMGDAGSAANDINQLRGRAQCSRMATAGDISFSFYLGRESKRVVHGGKKMVYVITYARLCHGGSTSAHAYYIADYPTYTGTISGNYSLIPQKAIDANIDAKLEQNPGLELEN